MVNPTHPTKEVVRLLLLYPDTDWNVKDTFGSTAYCDAVQMGHEEIQELFEEMDIEMGKLSDKQCAPMLPPIIEEDEKWRRKLSTSRVKVAEKYLI